MSLTKNYFINFSGYLLCFLPFMLLTGPFLSDLFVVLISVIITIIIIIEKEWFYFKNLFFYIFIFFYFYFLVLSLFSTDILLSLESSLFYFRFGLFSISVWYLLNNDKSLIERFFFIFLFTFTIALVDGYYQYFNDYNIFGLVSESDNRMTLILNDKMILGGYLSRLFPFLIGLIIFFNYKSKLIYLLILTLIISVDILIYISGERTALGILFISIIMIILLIPNLRFLRILAFFFTLISISIITLYDTDIRERNVDLTIDQLNLNDSNEDSSGIIYLSQAHQDLAFTSISIFKDNPITGVGPKLFRNYCQQFTYNNYEYSCSTHPHNIYLQLLAETGIIGMLYVFIPFLFIAFTFITHFFKKIVLHKKSMMSDFDICLLICFFVSLWPFLPSQNFFNNWISIIFYLPIGFYLFSRNNSETNNK